MAIRGKQNLKTVMDSKAVQARIARKADKLKSIENANESSKRTM